MSATETLRARIERVVRWKHRRETAEDLAILIAAWGDAYTIEPAWAGGWQAKRHGAADIPPLAARTLRDLHMVIRIDWTGNAR